MTLRLFFVASLVAFGLPVRAQPKQPTTQETLRPKIEAIQKEIDRRRQNDPKSAELLEADLRRVQDLLSGKLRPPADQPELHVVGFYAPAHWRTKVIIEVTEVDRPVILGLCAYEPVRWHIKLARGARIERVLLGGYHEQMLTWADPEIGEKVATELHTYENRNPIRFMAYQKDTSDFIELRRALKQLTDLEVASFQGSYKGEEGPYQIGPNSPAWMAEIIEKEVEPLYREATALGRARAVTDGGRTFKAIYQTPIPPPRVLPNGREMPPLPLEMQPTAVADFTLDGPIKDTIQQLPDRVRTTDVVVDDKGDLYGVTNHEVVRIDPKTLAVSPMKIGGDVPRLSWISGIAFDAKRKRLLVVNRRGELLAYDRDKELWTYVNTLNGLPQGPMACGALAYCDDSDCFYAISTSMGQRAEKPTLCRFAPDGTSMGTVQIDEVITTARGPDGGVQLTTIGANVVIITSPVFANEGRGAPAEPGHCLMVDPETGKVLSSKTITERVALAEDFKAAEVDRLWPLLGSANSEEAEQATQRLIAGGSHAADALASRVGAAKPLSAEQVQQLIGLLSNADANARERATTDLSQAGPSIVPQLRAAAEGELPAEARVRIATLLDELTDIEAGAKAPRAQLRRDRRLIRVLREIGTANAIEALIKLSASDTPGSTVANEARLALRKL
jgi:hypothetical protein